MHRQPLCRARAIAGGESYLAIDTDADGGDYAVLADTAWRFAFSSHADSEQSSDRLSVYVNGAIVSSNF